MSAPARTIGGPCSAKAFPLRSDGTVTPARGDAVEDPLVFPAWIIDAGVEPFRAGPPKHKASRSVVSLGPLAELWPGATAKEVGAAVDRSISVSMAMRKRGRLDCVLLDRTEHLTAFGGAVWNRLIELLEDGTLLSLGVSVRTPVEAHLALDNRDVSHLQLPFNVLDWRWLDCGVVDRVRARAGVTVHARNILLHGLLAFADLTKWPVDDEVCPARMLDDLQMLARQFGRASIPELCIAYVRGQDWIDGIVLDPGSDQHDCEVRSSLQPPLSLVECAALATRLPRLPERFFAE